MKYYVALLITILIIGCKENETKVKPAKTAKSNYDFNRRQNMIGGHIHTIMIPRPKTNLKLVGVDTITNGVNNDFTVVKTWKQIQDSKTLLKVWYKQDTARKLSITKQRYRTTIGLVGSTTFHLLPLKIEVTIPKKRNDTTLSFELIGRVRQHLKIFKLRKEGEYLECSYDE